MTGRENLQWLTATTFAYGGLHDDQQFVPENSSPAFARAIEQNCPIVLDARVIADQEVIVFHDDNLQRLCGVDKRVDSLTSFNFNYYKLAGTSENIPLLQDVLKQVANKVPLFIRINKQPGVKKPCLIILNALLGYKGRVAIVSESSLILDWFYRNAPTIPRGYLYAHQGALQMKAVFFRLCKPDFIAYGPAEPSEGLIRNWQLSGLILLNWTDEL